jgi:hypothetical protein
MDKILVERILQFEKSPVGGALRLRRELSRTLAEMD